MKAVCTKNEMVAAVVEKHGAKKDKLLAILLDLQDASGQNYLSEEICSLAAEALKMSPAKIYEAATFYSMLFTEPQAKYLIEVCSSTPCYFNKSKLVVDTLEAELGVKEGEQTADGLFIFYLAQCFGACDQSPAVKINHEVYGPLDSAEKIKALLYELRQRGEQ